MIDITTLPACLQEDGSTPGQEFPCRWDATAQGNGAGKSYVLPGVDAEPWFDATPVVAEQPNYTPVLTVEAPVTETLTVTPAAPAPAELAHTGIDPSGALLASAMLTVGAALVLVRKVARW
jgi:hypothetical protein